MTIDLVQTRTNFSMFWEISDASGVIAEAEAPFMRNMFLAEVRTPDAIRKIIHNPNDTSFGKSITDRVTFRIYDQDHYIGHILGKTQKVNRFLGSYPYYEYVDNEETYCIYEVGFGSKGLYLCFYRGDELLCIVEKELVTVNYRDRYKGYFADKALLPIVTTFMIYYDVVSYGDFLDVAVFSRKKSVVNTFQKELKKKYDPNFVPRIKEMDGIID